MRGNSTSVARRLPVVLLLAVSCALWIPRHRGPIDLRWDAAAYYTLATGLTATHQYVYLNEPGAIHAVVWPPGLPAFIALHQMAARSTDPVTVGTILRGTYFVLFTASVLLAYALLRRHLTPWLAAAGALMASLTMSAVWLSDRAYADLPFTVCVEMWLLAATARQPPSTNQLTVMGVVSVLAYTLRSAGIVLFAAWIIHAASHRARLRATAIAVACAAIAVASWSTYIHRVERSDEYAHPVYPHQRAPYSLYNVSYATNFALRDPNFPERGVVTWREWSRRVLDATPKVLPSIGAAITNSDQDWTAAISAAKSAGSPWAWVSWRIVDASLWTAGVLAFAGLLLLAVRGSAVYLVLVAIYTAQLCLLPTSYQWPRYLTALAPVIALGALTALTSLGGRFHGLSRAALVGLPIAATLAIQATIVWWQLATQTSAVVYQNWAGHRVTTQMLTYDDGFRTFDAAVDWVAAHAQPDDVVVSSMPHWVFLRTGRLSIMPPYERDTVTVLADLEAARARFVIVDTSGFSFTREYAQAALDTAATSWRKAFSIDQRVAVYERLSR